MFSYNRLHNKHALLERKDLTYIPKVSYIRGDIYIKKKHLKCYLKCCYILLQLSVRNWPQNVVIYSVGGSDGVSFLRVLKLIRVVRMTI